MDIEDTDVYEAQRFMKTEAVKTEFAWLLHFNVSICKLYNIDCADGDYVMECCKRVFKRYVVCNGPVHHLRVRIVMVTCYMMALKFAIDLPKSHMADCEIVESLTYKTISCTNYINNERHMFQVVSKYLMQDICRNS